MASDEQEALISVNTPLNVAIILSFILFRRSSNTDLCIRKCFRNCTSFMQRITCNNSPTLGVEGNVLFNDALYTFYLQLYGVGHNFMVRDHSDSERGNLLPPHGLLFPTSSKGSFICIGKIAHTTAFVTQSWGTGWNEK